MALLGGRLTLFPALRFDFYELDPADDPLLPNFEEAGQSGSRLSPKLGVTFEVFDDVLLFGNYAQGFRAPTPSQVNNFFENLAFGYTSLPNPDLGPERSESWEAGIRFLGDGVTASLVAFRADYEDFISQQVVSGSFTPTDPAVFQFVNFDEVEIEGLEASASYRADNGLTGRFAIAYADGDTLSPGSDPVPLDTIDPLNLVAGLGYDDPRGRFGVELIMTHHARKDAEEAVGAGCGDNCVRPDAFTILDATAFVAINDALKLRAGLFNLTDETYAFWTDVRGLSVTSPTPVEAFTRPGRNASLSLSFQF
jgi:hemoglobin/transferrin/lactoferrin receptor protein